MNNTVILIVMLVLLCWIFRDTNEQFTIKSRKYMLPDDPYVNIRHKNWLLEDKFGYYHITDRRYTVPHWWALNGYYNKISPYLDYSAYLF